MGTLATVSNALGGNAQPFPLFRGKRPRIVTGLDIGTTKICAIVGRMDEDGVLNILGVGSHQSIGLKKGMVVDIDATVDSIRQAVRKAEQMADVPIRDVYVGIAGSHITSHNGRGAVEVANSVRGVTESDRQRALDKARDIAMPRDTEVIHFIPQEWVCDGQTGIRNPLGMSCSTLEVRTHMVMAALTSASNIVKCCSMADLSTRDIVLESLASSAAILTEEEKDLGVLMIDIGGGTSDVAVFSQGSVKFSAVIPLGGDSITNDVAVGLKCSRHDAENLKKRHGCALTDMVSPDDVFEVTDVLRQERSMASRHLLADVCEARLEQIFLMAKEMIQNSPARDRVFAGVVLTGGTSLMEGIERLAERLFGLPVKVGHPVGLKGLSGVVGSPIYSTGIGLVMHGFIAEPVKDSMFNQGNMFQRFLHNLKRFIDWYA